MYFSHVISYGPLIPAKKVFKMRSIRTSIVAAATAAAVAFSASPALAAEEGSNASSTSSTSSTVATELDATDSQRAVWGSTKDFDSANGFDQLTYVYTVASLATIVGGAAAFASQTPQARAIAKQFNIELPRFY